MRLARLPAIAWQAALALLLAASVALLAAEGQSAVQGKRPLAVDNLYDVRDVRDPQPSPDGKWVAYTVTRAIRETDKNDADVWMVSWDAREQIQLTSTPDNESRPRFSPDGKFLSFLSSRQGAKTAQLWLLNRGGGEAAKLTDIKGGISDYAWSPDSRSLALSWRSRIRGRLTRSDDEAIPAKTAKPIVVDRYYFKSDTDGYLRGERSHLYLFDLASRRAEMLTTGSFDETAPAWSPDGSQIAFVRRHRDTGDVDVFPNSDLFVIDARAGAAPRRLTNATAEETGPLSWSPDGKQIAFRLGDEVKYSAYDQASLAVVPIAGGAVRPLTAQLDRPINTPVWSADGRTLTFGFVDDRSQYRRTRTCIWRLGRAPHRGAPGCKRTLPRPR